MRIFERTIRKRPGSDKPEAAYWLHCRVCSNVKPFNPTMGAQKAAQTITRKARELGWKLGKDEHDDVCPACLIEVVVERSIAQGGRAVDFTITPDNEVLYMMDHPNPENNMKVVDVAAVKRAPVDPKNPPRPARPEEVIPPDTLTRETRRIIFLKVEEVYVDEKVGYSKGWSDEKVASDLSVPVAWVATIREENFGPNKSEDASSLLEAGAALVHDANLALCEMKDLRSRMNACLDKMGKIGVQIEKFDKQYKELQTKYK